MARAKIERQTKLVLPDEVEDRAITDAANADPNAKPVTEDEWASMRRVPRQEVARLQGRPPLPESERKQRVTMYLDRDVIEQLKHDGKGWQTRANAKLREALGL